MAKTRKSTKRHSKKKYSKKKQHRKSNNKQTQMLHWRDNPFPRNLITVFTYGEEVSATTTGAGAIPATYLWAGNAIYDPNITGAGAQPRYYDTLLGPDGGSAPYRAYTVYASKIKLWVVLSSAADAITQNSLVCLTAMPNVTGAPVTLKEMLERPESKRGYLTYTGGNQLVCIIKKYQKSAPMFGVQDPSDSKDMIGQYNTNPTNSWYWNVTAVSISEGLTATYRFMVQIKYYCKLHELNDVADS